MAGRTATEELELIDVGGHDAGFGGDFGPGPRGGGAAIPQRIYLTGIWIALAGVLTFFMALTSSYIVRHGLGGDWEPVPLPRILWANTVVLLASSVTLELARRALARNLAARFALWWKLTSALGIGFLAGQILAWRELAAAGVFLASNPSSSFFYLLTSVHGLHLLGGILALLYVGAREWNPPGRSSRRTAVRATTIYWHFLGGLWLFLFMLLHLGR